MHVMLEAHLVDGMWNYNKKLPQSWQVNYKNLTFNIKPMGFKHTGLFPEQAVNWDWMINKISNSNRPIKVLNLFAYTGGATVACLSAGATVCHVDSSKGMIEWDMANGEKLERWKNITLIRPDPQIIWKDKSYPELWKKADARYARSSSGGRNVEL